MKTAYLFALILVLSSALNAFGQGTISFNGVSLYSGQTYSESGVDFQVTASGSGLVRDYIAGIQAGY